MTAYDQRLPGQVSSMGSGESSVALQSRQCLRMDHKNTPSTTLSTNSMDSTPEPCMTQHGVANLPHPAPIPAPARTPECATKQHLSIFDHNRLPSVVHITSARMTPTVVAAILLPTTAAPATLFPSSAPLPIELPRFFLVETPPEAAVPSPKFSAPDSQTDICGCSKEAAKRDKRTPSKRELYLVYL